MSYENLSKALKDVCDGYMNNYIFFKNDHHQQAEYMKDLTEKLNALPDDQDKIDALLVGIFGLEQYLIEKESKDFISSLHNLMGNEEFNQLFINNSKKEQFKDSIAAAKKEIASPKVMPMEGEPRWFELMPKVSTAQDASFSNSNRMEPV